MAALASLTEQYTDSENEDHHDDDSDDEKLYSDPEEKQIKGEIVKTSSKKALRLVSYNDNEAHEEDDEDIHDVEHETTIEEEPMEVDEVEKFMKYTKKYGFQLPPEPKSKPNPKLQEMVTNIVQKMDNNPNYDLNQYIQQKKSFRNPSIYDKLIQFCRINELGTNFPKDFYDVSIYGPESFYEELAKAQKAEMDKQEKQKKENIKTEILEGVSKESKRKSKWDQQSVDGKLVQTSSSTSSSSGKTTVINAFGNLKKPKI